MGFALPALCLSLPSVSQGIVKSAVTARGTTANYKQYKAIRGACFKFWTVWLAAGRGRGSRGRAETQAGVWCDPRIPGTPNTHTNKESEYDNAGRGGGWVLGCGCAYWGRIKFWCCRCRQEAACPFLCAASGLGLGLGLRLLVLPARAVPPAQGCWKLPEARRLSCRVRGVPSDRLPTSAAMLL